MIKICVSPGQFHPRIEHEPRISQGQREAMLKLVKEDQDAAMRGFDQKMRPVVVYRNPSAERRSTFALMRNGNATLVRMPLVEHWT